MRERRSLPVLGQPPPERADAARNRQKIIEAASRMVAESGAGDLSLDEVAREACVGVGTVYRRFGDRTGLLLALLDERERRFQAAFLSGPPPLGPGAPARERIVAFLHALADRILADEALFLLLEKGAARRFSGPYRVHHVHLATLLAQVCPGADTVYLADALLAPVNAHLIACQREERGMTVERVKAGLEALVMAVTRPTP
ncbi:Transcriptional regulator, TetR family [[Actinomadura] parvosata subsp. kistnae]|uniref:TetR family transcriptional regulator n=1 Tax=[Actinomadura] parvosata subsp. kistnae TaxID=1909395 RepID=A0A1V0AEY3_9ACTN|nr:TetR/AcrR family transcriptional regulator [Nonomuraea sp. ATCC 55076]AQZ68777.1 TetR family transcriptional regulator [Nonomuraea sp. ATCC 55076]SPL92713.1 Transcriptional regulator, TetR family [Actinomadura parvosata subsp. kistnae]